MKNKVKKLLSKDKRIIFGWITLYILVDFVIYTSFRRYIPDFGFLFSKEEMTFTGF